MKKDFNIKELLQDKRKRALIILGGYIIFFMLISLGLKGAIKGPELKLDSLPKTKIPLLEKYENMSNYTQIFKRNNLTITEVRYDEEKLINYNDKEYYFNKLLYEKVENEYIVSEDIFDDFYYLLNPSNIHTLINMANYTSKQENFETKTIINIYSMEISEFQILLNDTEEKEGTIMISVHENETDIIKIDIDLSQYSQNIDEIINIIYEDIDNVKPFNINI